MIKLRNLLSERQIQQIQEQVKQVGKPISINFDSGKWKMTSDLKRQIDIVIRELEAQLKTQNIPIGAIHIEGSESKIPNYDGEQSNPRKYPLEPGKLSERRIKTITDYLYRDATIKSAAIKITIENKGAQGDEWDTAKGSEHYRPWQYVKAIFHAPDDPPMPLGKKYPQNVYFDGSVATGDVNSILTAMKNTIGGEIGYMDASDEYMEELRKLGVDIEMLKSLRDKYHKIPLDNKTLDERRPESLFKAFKVEGRRDLYNILLQMRSN